MKKHYFRDALTLAKFINANFTCPIIQEQMMSQGLMNKRYTGSYFLLLSTISP